MIAYSLAKVEYFNSQIRDKKGGKVQSNNLSIFFVVVRGKRLPLLLNPYSSQSIPKLKNSKTYKLINL